MLPRCSVMTRLIAQTACTCDYWSIRFALPFTKHCKFSSPFLKQQLPDPKFVHQTELTLANSDLLWKSRNPPRHYRVQYILTIMVAFTSQGREWRIHVHLVLLCRLLYQANTFAIGITTVLPWTSIHLSNENLYYKYRLQFLYSILFLRFCEINSNFMTHRIFPT